MIVMKVQAAKGTHSFLEEGEALFNDRVTCLERRDFGHSGSRPGPHLLAVGLRTSYINSLSLSLLICKNIVIVIPPLFRANR